MGVRKGKPQFLAEASHVVASLNLIEVLQVGILYLDRLNDTSRRDLKRWGCNPFLYKSPILELGGQNRSGCLARPTKAFLKFPIASPIFDSDMQRLHAGAARSLVGCTVLDLSERWMSRCRRWAHCLPCLVCAMKHVVFRTGVCFLGPALLPTRQVAEEIEHSLDIVGATAIEDKLQEPWYPHSPRALEYSLEVLLASQSPCLNLPHSQSFLCLASACQSARSSSAGRTACRRPLSGSGTPASSCGCSLETSWRPPET